MKKSIQIIGVLAVVLVTLFGCKKKDVEVQKEERFSMAINMVTKAGNQNAIMIGTKAELKAALTEGKKRVLLKRVSERNNVYLPVVGQPPVDPTPADPTQLCWDEIEATIAANIVAWQQSANQTCKPAMYCLGCPNVGLGLQALYPVTPNCGTLPDFEANYGLLSFKYSNDELDSDAVAMLINPKR